MAKSTPARGANGRFKKGSGGSAKKRKSAPRAVTRAIVTPAAFVAAAPAKRRPATKTRTVTIVKKAKRRASAGGGGSTSMVASLKRMAKPLAGSFAYGWVTSADSEYAQKARAVIAKVPTIKAIGAPATHGIILTFIATRTKGRVREVCDVLGAAALHRAAYNLGASNMDLGKAAAVAGDDDMAGDMDDDDEED